MEPLKSPNTETTSREKLPDLLKGFGIILVVLGHCIQVGSGTAFNAESLYFSDKFYQFIYSFHMPLFMMVSGYLSWGSMQRATSGKQRVDLLKRRVKVLITPVFLWITAEYLIKLIINLVNGNRPQKTFLFEYINNILNNFWFLWAVFWCFLIVFIMHYFFKDSVILYILGFMVMFFIPDGMALGAYKYMMPYFIVPFYLHKYMDKNNMRLDVKPKAGWIVLSGIVFVGMFMFFDENSFIYLSGYKLVGKDVVRQLKIDFYRMIIGFVGSAFFILIWQYILAMCKGRCEFKILTALGKNSMGIYIISTYLLVYVVQNLNLAEQPFYPLNAAQAVVVLAVSLLLAELLGKLHFVRKFVGK
ncbi:MAG: acyltransferase family protein [Lachnospiraceae bacterium]|nr:acyltransferase family protein [Lachnospiraceae bacterium]